MHNCPRRPEHPGQNVCRFLAHFKLVVENDATFIQRVAKHLFICAIYIVAGSIGGMVCVRGGESARVRVGCVGCVGLLNKLCGLKCRLCVYVVHCS